MRMAHAGRGRGGCPIGIAHVVCWVDGNSPRAQEPDMTISALPVSALLLVLGWVPAGICLAQGLPATASGRFEALDTNRDGFVRKGEYNTDALFAAIDSDRNSRITAAELEAILGPQGDGELSAADRIRLADRNVDGELDHEELRRSAEMRFQRLDGNRDDILDLAEFRAGFGRP
jgi:hypothetical protein